VEKATRQGFWPDTFSTDWNTMSRTTGVGDFPNVMSKFIMFGMPLSQIIACVACDVLKESGHATEVLTTEAGTRAERFYHTDGWTEVGRKEDGRIIFQKSLPARATNTPAFSLMKSSTKSR
jgi:hypothetical protein